MRSLPRTLTLMTLATIVLGLAALPHAVAQTGYEAPEVEGDVFADGNMEDDPWSSGGRYRVELQAVDGSGSADATLFLLNNGTALFIAVQAELDEQNDGDWIRVRFASAPDGDLSQGSDEIRFDGMGPGVYQDGFHGEEWVLDESRSGCGLHGEGARTVSEVTTAYEFGKPFSADDCDFSVQLNDTLAFQVELHDAATGRTFAFPGGGGSPGGTGNGTDGNASGENGTGADDETANGSAWAGLRIAAPVQDPGEVQGPGETRDSDPGLETGPEDGLDENRPVQPVGPEGGAYDARREAPALPLVMALLGLVALLWFVRART